MKKIIIVRHGEYATSTSALTKRGGEQMRGLARKFAIIAKGKSLKLLTSTARRALESAAILADGLGVKAEEHAILWSDSDRAVQLDPVLSLIDQHWDLDILILVTHLEYVEYLPPRIADKIGAVGFPHWELARGDAWVIDCEERTCDRAAFM